MNVIELCAGAGGMSLGFHLAGFNHRVLVDNNKHAVNTLKENFTNTRIELADITKHEYYGEADVLVAGLPCPSFSLAGKRLGLQDPRGALFFSFLHYLDGINPSVFVIENVKGLTTKNMSETFLFMLKELRARDYFVSYAVLNANDYDTPQKRERLFMVGSLVKPFIFPPKINPGRVLRDVLSTPISNDVGLVYNDKKRFVMSHVNEGGNWNDLLPSLQQDYMGKAYFSSGGRTGIARRLSRDKPSPTLVCSPTQKTTELCHPIETRPLSVGEYKRIQGFPDSYIITGSVMEQYKQVGNAVPVNLAKAVAEQIKRQYFI